MSGRGAPPEPTRWLNCSAWTSSIGHHRGRSRCTGWPRSAHSGTPSATARTSRSTCRAKWSPWTATREFYVSRSTTATAPGGATSGSCASTTTASAGTSRSGRSRPRRADASVDADAAALACHGRVHLEAALRYAHREVRRGRRVGGCHRDLGREGARTAGRGVEVVPLNTGRGDAVRLQHDGADPAGAAHRAVLDPLGVREHRAIAAQRVQTGVPVQAARRLADVAEAQHHCRGAHGPLRRCVRYVDQRAVAGRYGGTLYCAVRRCSQRTEPGGQGGAGSNTGE